VSIEPSFDIWGKMLNIIYDIDPGDLESILQCGQKLDVAKEVMIRGSRVVRFTVSG